MLHSHLMTDTQRLNNLCISLASLFLAFIVFQPAFAQSAPQSTHDPHLQALDWLTHGTWTAEVTTEDGKPFLVQNEIRWAETGTAIYFLTRFNHHAHYYGVYLYDPAAGQIKFFYSASDGEMTVGHSDPDANEVRQEFQISSTRGTTTFHSLMKRDGQDAYDFTVYQQSSDKPIFAVHYIRK